MNNVCLTCGTISNGDTTTCGHCGCGLANDTNGVLLPFVYALNSLGCDIIYSNIGDIYNQFTNMCILYTHPNEHITKAFETNNNGTIGCLTNTIYRKYVNGKNHITYRSVCTYGSGLDYITINELDENNEMKVVVYYPTNDYVYGIGFNLCEKFDSSTKIVAQACMINTVDIINSLKLLIDTIGDNIDETNIDE